MKLVTQPISLRTLRQLALAQFGNLVKAVVDVEKGTMVIDAELHADEEAFLLKQGSKQEDLWGINLYPEKSGDELIEFDSMINLRPSANNLSRSIDDPQIRQDISQIIDRLVK